MMQNYRCLQHEFGSYYSLKNTIQCVSTLNTLIGLQKQQFGVIEDNRLNDDMIVRNLIDHVETSFQGQYLHQNKLTLTVSLSLLAMNFFSIA